ncbi:exonuclease 1-like [Planoprotostelium fungivorum]|uniref:Exonuclease 1 n=1 Tax=Planoprotostelium fungivorum TaxID=1890364 RepID=A0A2P6NV18_9EUKA|nr:exonuclease 1-like [Planoprotostelium fungivorum]
MGISGLLPILSSITRDVHLNDYQGLTAAIDMYGWLHRGAYGCSSELCQNIPTDGYIKFCMKRIEMLRQNGITPIAVFDGAALPMKSGTEKDRRQNREKHRSKGMLLIREGNAAAARESFSKAIDISPNMVCRVIDTLRSEDIQVIVSPYEADAQLAYLVQQGIAHFAISEDSDLLAFGCDRVLFKMDNYCQGKEIKLSDLPNNAGLSFVHFTHEMFRHVCILSGCDYLPSVPGMGIKKAHDLVKKFRSIDRVIGHMRSHGKLSAVVPADYEEKFRRADLTFQHQRVWDPLNGVLTRLQPLPDWLDDENMDLSFMGGEVEHEVAVGIATGKVNPRTGESYEKMKEGEQTTTSQVRSGSIGSTRVANVLSPFTTMSTKTISKTITVKKTEREIITEPNAKRQKTSFPEDEQEESAKENGREIVNTASKTILVSRFFPLRPTAPSPTLPTSSDYHSPLIRDGRMSLFSNKSGIMSGVRLFGHRPFDETQEKKIMQSSTSTIEESIESDDEDDRVESEDERVIESSEEEVICSSEEEVIRSDGSVSQDGGSLLDDEVIRSDDEG